MQSTNYKYNKKDILRKSKILIYEDLLLIGLVIILSIIMIGFIIQSIGYNILWFRLIVLVPMNIALIFFGYKYGIIPLLKLVKDINCKYMEVSSGFFVSCTKNRMMILSIYNIVLKSPQNKKMYYNFYSSNNLNYKEGTKINLIYTPNCRIIVCLENALE